MSRVVMSLLVIGVIGLAAGLAPAAYTIDLVPSATPGVGGGMPPTGYTSYDLLFSVDTNTTVGQLYLKADAPQAGDIFQFAGGGDEEPTPFLIGFAPDIAFDTYHTGSFVGAAVNIIPGVRDATMDDQLFDYAWGYPGTSGPVQNFIAARITVKDGRTIYWTAYQIQSFTSGGAQPFETSGVIPEPATLMVLLAGGLLGLCRRR